MDHSATPWSVFGSLFACIFAAKVLAAEPLPVFWPSELTALSPRLSLQQDGDFIQWQQQGRQTLRQSYLWPGPLPQVQAERLRRTDRGSYWHEHWRAQLLTPHWQHLRLLIPKTASTTQPKPAVLLLHDHGAEFRLGKEKWIRPDDHTKLPLAQQWADKYFSGHFVGELLAEQGFVVLAADTLGFGERGILPYAQQQQLAANFLARGHSLAGFTALEDQQLAAFLAAQPLVRPGQITALGFSMGAYRVWQLAALSEHIHAAVGIGWFNQLADLTTAGGNFSKGQSSFYLLHPGLFNTLDLPDIAALAAPKPLLLVMGGKDPLMPASGIHQGFLRLQQHFQKCAAQNVNQQARVQLSFWPEKGHVFDQEMQQRVFHWLAHGVVAATCTGHTSGIAAD